MDSPAPVPVETVDRNTWLTLVEIARFAPSPHNGQAWAVKVDPGNPGKATLQFDPIGGLPNTDPGSRFTWAGLGCFTETLCRTARAHGLDLGWTLLDTTLDAAPGRPLQDVAEFTLTPTPDHPPTPEEVHQLDLIRQRRVSRKRFNRVPIPGTVFEGIAGELLSEYGQTLYWTDDRRFVGDLVELNAATLLLDLRETVPREELWHFVNTSERASGQRARGFSPSSLAIPGPVVSGFFRMHRLVSLPGVEWMLRKLYKVEGNGVGSVFWLRGRFTTPEEQFQAGRGLVAFQLHLTDNGYVSQPYGSVKTNQTTFGRVGAMLQSLEKRVPAVCAGRPSSVPDSTIDADGVRHYTTTGPDARDGQEVWMAGRGGTPAFYARNPGTSHRVAAGDLVH